ncbi:RNA polymerase sigma-70 factor, ECF subfamily [Chitinophaga eiseniae]|uniref:RNA polymerase sigma-70 factor, ECF subfamily n=1 Tax=Chitinophaga eiseniae TaxID=634771 RepID=A0A1T4U5G7_9BACT|nr:sigma-70 family RNA polymerase sigma factor [Chitinophaga eiseniae]SKA47768.1 RNA polymerase sigma-70 factor, ECF subfamily [Chitinophaga eiseniae]
MKELSTYTEQELITALKLRREEAFNYLYDHYSAALNGVIRNIIPEVHTATDLLQEVFIKIWRQIDNYDPSRGRLYTWMFTIARTAAIDHVRSKSWQNSLRNSELTEGSQQLADHNILPSDELGLRKIVHTLKDEHKAVLELSYFQGYTQEEIARLINIPVNTVKTRIRAAILQLKKKIKR